MTTPTIEEPHNHQPARVHQGMELNEYQQIRLEKAEKLRSIGIDPYPPRFKERTHSIGQVLADFDNLSKDEQGHIAKDGTTVTVAGRILGKRDQKVVFADLIEDGERIQLYLKDKNLEAGADGLNLFKETVDLGDIVGVQGVPFVTHKGDRTIEVHHWWMLSKAINQPPDKYAGLTDKETRYRQRYVDLMANEEVRDVFIKRSKIISAFRHFLDSKGFLEVETPTLQPLYGGALARPFTTHHNALDRTFYLRIADELYLKRLLVGGYGKVYEICKDFRNEGIDASHNPEFTMLEFYQAFADYEDIMQLAEDMFNFVATETLGTNKFTYRGQAIDLTPPFRRMTMQDAIFEYSGIDYQKYPEQADLYQQLKAKGVDVEPSTVWPKLVDEAFKTFVRPKLVQPTFIYDYPQKLSPLAKRKPGQPDTVERFQPIIGGLECGNAFSELNDPFDQRARFLEQKRNEEAGDDEAMQMDDDFINALMHGMPPTGGMGIGIDRLVMLLTNQESVRDVILFPQMRTIE